MLKKLLLKQKTKKNNIVRERFCTYQDAEEVGILFQEQEDLNGIEYLQSELRADGKKVFLLMKVENYDKNKAYDFPFFYDKDVSISGNIESDTLDQFVNQSLDMLLILDEKPNPTTQYVISKCQSLKIGCLTDINDIQHLDLIVQPKQSSKKYEELLSYLRKVA